MAVEVGLSVPYPDLVTGSRTLATGVLALRLRLALDHHST